MGWWETQKGVVIGDPALDVLDAQDDSTVWNSAVDIPPQVVAQIVEAYRQGIGREPTLVELETLLAFQGRRAQPDSPKPFR